MYFDYFKFIICRHFEFVNMYADQLFEGSLPRTSPEQSHKMAGLGELQSLSLIGKLHAEFLHSFL